MVRRKASYQTNEPPEDGAPQDVPAEESSVYARGQTVIPKMIREAAAIEYGTRLHWEVREGVIQVTPIPAKPILAARGFLKARGVTFQWFMQQRQLERERERKEEALWQQKHPAKGAAPRRPGGLS
jgi:bifunctional DNA-binding transcriptional regulator/antitoxin component of YhaV-PrlF toxin-antitoxin module